MVGEAGRLVFWTGMAGTTTLGGEMEEAPDLVGRCEKWDGVREDDDW
jgi:hypothetical protein